MHRLGHTKDAEMGLCSTEGLEDRPNFLFIFKRVQSLEFQGIICFLFQGIPVVQVNTPHGDETEPLRVHLAKWKNHVKDTMIFTGSLRTGIYGA